MKILQICAVDITVENMLKPLMAALESEHHIVHVACSDTGKVNELRDQGLIIHDIPIERKLSFNSNLKAVYHLFLLMKKERYDIVHVHTPIAAILGRIAAKLSFIPTVIYTAHGYYFHEGMSKIQYKIFYWIEKFFARHFTDWLLLQSKEDYQLSLSNSFKNHSEIKYLGNGVDVITKFNPALIDQDVILNTRNDLGISETDKVICFIGRFVKEKGIFDLIDSFERLHEKDPNLKLLMIGGTSRSERDQKSLPYLEMKIGSYPSIINTGFRKDIPELLSISDIFVLPSYREGLPRSIIEAMAMELPVVASNIRGSREEVCDGVNGYLFEKGNTDDLTEKLESLLLDKEKRKRFGQEGRFIALNEFNEQIVLEKQKDLIRQLDCEQNID